MNVYENIVILDAALPDETVDAAREKIKELIAGSGGEVLRVENWGRRKLAYEIKKKTRGYFYLFLFKAQPSLIKKMEDSYKVYDPIIKSMFVRLVKKQKAATLKALAAETAPQTTAAPAAAPQTAAQ